MSLSQCSSLTAAGSGASLLQELASFLRRSLTHQAAVRETLYHVRPQLTHHTWLECSLWTLCSDHNSSADSPYMVPFAVIHAWDTMRKVHCDH